MHLQLKNNEIIPADMLLLETSSTERTCFVETANLDGETNLKQRRLFSEAFVFNPATFNEVLLAFILIWGSEIALVLTLISW